MFFPKLGGQFWKGGTKEDWEDKVLKLSVVGLYHSFLCQLSQNADFISESKYF